MGNREEKDLYFEVASPCDGQVVPMEEIGDPVFASGALGQAIGIIPSDSTVYAPVSGKLVQLAETKHAFTVEQADGQSVLVHVGIDTVSLGGKGFRALVKQGDEITAGQPVLSVDFRLVKENRLDPTVVVILLN